MEFGSQHKHFQCNHLELKCQSRSDDESGVNYVVLNDAESFLRRRVDWDDANDFTVTEALNKWNKTLEQFAALLVWISDRGV